MLVDDQSVRHLSRPMTAAAVRLARQRIGLSHSEMARTLRVGLRTIFRWESGESEIPGPAAAVMRMMEVQVCKDGRALP